MSTTSRRTWLLHIGTALAAAGGPLPARAQSSPNVELMQLQAQKSDEGLVLSYQVRFDLPQEVEDALMKGLAVVFVARAEIFTERWYWTDKTRALIERRWRLAYQPLSRHWRVSFDGLSQNYGSLAQALAIIQRNGRWRLTDAPADDDASYLEFSFELDRNELPRPLQIGLSDQHEWHLQTRRRIPLPR